MNPDSKIAASLWFYFSKDETVHGPIPLQDLLTLIQSGTLSRDVLAVPEGREDWKPFSEWDTPERPRIPASGPAEAAPLPPRRSPQRPFSERAKPIHDEPAHEALKLPQGTKQGCGGCLVLVVLAMLFGFVFETCSKQALTLTDEERQDPKAAVQKLMKAIYGGDLRSTDATVIYGDVAAGMLNVEVRVNASLQYSASSNRFTIQEKLAEAFKTLYTSGLPIWDVTVWNYGELIDRYGNEKEDIVHKTSLHLREASKVNWANSNQLLLEGLWEVNFMHPILRD